MKMKTLVVGTAVLLGFSSYSLAYSIDNGATDVGSLDTYLAGTALTKSDKATETNWVNTWLNENLGSTTTYTFADKTGSVEVEAVDNGLGGLNIDNSAFGAFKLQKEPAYFLVKKGAGNNSADGNSHWLFENTASLDWGVVNFTALFGDKWNNEGNFTISHVTEFVGDFPVPEPGTLALMVTGVAGLFAARRRTRTAA